MITETYHYNLGQIFDKVACQWSGNSALKYPDGKCYSYGELNCLSNKIVNYLIENGKIGRAHV